MSKINVEIDTKKGKLEVTIDGKKVSGNVTSLWASKHTLFEDEDSEKVRIDVTVEDENIGDVKQTKILTASKKRSNLCGGKASSEFPEFYEFGEEKKIQEELADILLRNE